GVAAGAGDEPVPGVLAERGEGAALRHGVPRRLRRPQPLRLRPRGRPGGREARLRDVRRHRRGRELDATSKRGGTVSQLGVVTGVRDNAPFPAKRRPFFIEGTGRHGFGMNWSIVNCSGAGLLCSRRIGRSPQLSLEGGVTHFAFAHLEQSQQSLGRRRGAARIRRAVGALERRRAPGVPARLDAFRRVHARPRGVRAALPRAQHARAVRRAVRAPPGRHLPGEARVLHEPIAEAGRWRFEPWQLQQGAAGDLPCRGERPDSSGRSHSGERR
ncbi:MAG: hypothetical protein JWL60_1770, partial [Gemmatimonadetes bacterium]|nr:hypothetical protein [Gemmatimonadota bacterium]